MTPRPSIPYRLLSTLQENGGSMESIRSLCLAAEIDRCNAIHWMHLLESHKIITVKPGGPNGRKQIMLTDDRVIKWHEVITGVSL